MTLKNYVIIRKCMLVLSVAVLLASAAAHGDLYTESFTAGSLIPDGNPVGVTLAANVNDVASGDTVAGLTVSLNITGGFNGDLYAYLVAPNGTLVTLMNRPGLSVNGIGAAGAGMNVTLLDGPVANGNIQGEISASMLSGTYNAAESLSLLNGSVADGQWTLYFADLASGGGTSTLNNWSLGITTVPEPSSMAFGLFAGFLALLSLMRRRWMR